MASATIATICDPLSINLSRQTEILLSSFLANSPYAETLTNCATHRDLLEGLSRLLYVPALTPSVASLFRPILLDLCARWLYDNDNDAEDKLVALTLLLEPHEELYPALSSLLHKPAFQNGPLAFITQLDSSSIIPTSRLHRTLLAYYRILQANRQLPYHLSWPLAPLSQLFWNSYIDAGTRLLAIRCYALQCGMGEGERERLEEELLGKTCTADCPVEYGENIDGSKNHVDGWMLPVLELKRVTEARNSLLEPQNYYLNESDISQAIHPSELSQFTVNVHGILLLRSPGSPMTTSNLIPTPSVVEALRKLAIHLSLRLPILLTSAPSSGKSLLISHLANIVHPGVKNQIITIHLADTSLDPRSLLGSYASSPTQPGTFEWKEGVLVRAMREGKWVVFEDIDRGSNEVLGVIKPLVESLGLGKWIGGRAVLDLPSRGRVEADEGFFLFATRSSVPSRTGSFPEAVFFGAHKFHEVVISPPTPQEMRLIIDSHFPRLAGPAAQGLIQLWEVVKNLQHSSPVRDLGMRELMKYCSRVDNLLPSTYLPMDFTPESGSQVRLSEVFSNPTLREDMYSDARDVFFGAGAVTAPARSYTQAVATSIADHLALDADRREWILQGQSPAFDVEKDVNDHIIAVRAGRTRLLAKAKKHVISTPTSRPFAMHKPAISLMSRIATAVSLGEPILLTGETGTGKTSIISHLSSLLNRPLVSLNLSHQTESSDLLGGFKPLDARIPGFMLQEQFLDLFSRTFSRKKNANFEELTRKAVSEGKWKRAVALWKESVRKAKDRIRARMAEQPVDDYRGDRDNDTPRKRRKIDQDSLNASEENWSSFEREVGEFDVQHVQAKGKFAFAFVEGPLVKALRSGDWVLLDEINLASPETLECITSILQGPTASITLTEQGSLEPVPRHPDFRLFACMNPATDVGKKDLIPSMRSRFTEIDVPPPDADRETLLSIVTQYIGSSAVGDKAAIMNVAEFYSAVKALAEERRIADGSNRRPHYSMRTLARALTFAADVAPMYGLRRSIWEGSLMAFTMVLDPSSAFLVTELAKKHLLAGVRNPGSLLTRLPSLPHSRREDEFVKFGPFYLERGPLPEDLMEEYILTPSVESKLVDLARIIVTRRFPVLIEGPTSSGKTSSIEYIAKRTGHRFVRINNHEHTDIQEYLGSFVSDPTTGKLVFKDGLLVRALRAGDWIVLDELNLAPTDVLEALNRLLDDNRELVIPETQEVVRPHPHFMLFATQNPPGLYAGRKVLSRAFRNRFLEVHFEDVPQAELETILCQRCRIAPPYGQRIVSVFRELQKRRQAGRVFETKQGFATLRDLFRWAGRDAVGYQELAENGYMLLAERARQHDDKVVVKEVIESIMKVRIDEKAIYDFDHGASDFTSFFGFPLPQSSQLVWTYAMRRLFVLISRALKYNEPILLVGETGTGKTSVCQVYADAVSRRLHSLNCHQNTETADLIGGLRPIRGRAATEAQVLQDMKDAGLLQDYMSGQPLLLFVEYLLQSDSGDSLRHRSFLEDVHQKLIRLTSMFYWHDGPLVEAMRNGNIFLLDEISLADDSVLERLNSVLEPGRAIVLAERGGDGSELPIIQAADSFKLVATMNPGGDYGKKELSPALRNRFTEIWVPAVEDRRDLDLIVDRSWKHEVLRPYTARLLDFVEWLSARLGDRTILNLRDILAWVAFSNSILSKEGHDTMSLAQIFHHAAHMTFLDGFGSIPQLASYSAEALQYLKREALTKLQEIAPITDVKQLFMPDKLAQSIQVGPFAILKGSESPSPHLFNLQAPTTQSNVLRIIRASQLSKPILLEGSPGVGKTSLITTLANIAGHHLCRINLSDQTDLIDLFGADLPIEGGAPGDFAWKDAEFLTALQEGHWVLLDEMNLAPQAVLEGLNAILDHRGTVFIPELNRSFTRHPNFRIFAAQNPLHQGGGRKGLPKSFVNRFTKVFIDELSAKDLLLVCTSLFPACNSETLQAMITFNTRLNEEVALKRSFGREGSPWEFNLRDVIRWGSLLNASSFAWSPVHYLRDIYLQRFRTIDDRECALRIFEDSFSTTPDCITSSPHPTISATHIQVGHFNMPRGNFSSLTRSPKILQCQLSALESVGVCITQSWLAIITGPRQSGKTGLVRVLANYSGHPLQEIVVNGSTDTMDLLGSFEQISAHEHMISPIQQIASLVDQARRSIPGTKVHAADYNVLQAFLRAPSSRIAEPLSQAAANLLDDLACLGKPFHAKCLLLQDEIRQWSTISSTTGKFEWVDGPLVRAIKDGQWLLMDGANLCNPSVLDRLNSLCEMNGVLTLSERGYINGKVPIIRPHPNFRLFMTVDPRYGELSRAMRNRGLEIALMNDFNIEDRKRLNDYFRLPSALMGRFDDYLAAAVEFDTFRRGISIGRVDLPLISWPVNQVSDQASSLSALSAQASALWFANSQSKDIQDSIVHLSINTTPSAYYSHFMRLTSAFWPADQTLVQRVRIALQALSNHPLFNAFTTLHDDLGQSWNIPSSFIATQPLNISLCCSTLLEQIPPQAFPLSQSVTQILDIFVALFIDETDGMVTRIPSIDGAFGTQIQSGNIDRIWEESHLVINEVNATARNLIQRPDWTESKVHVECIIEYLQYTRSLRGIIASSSLDYSAVKAITELMTGPAYAHLVHFPDLTSRVQALQSTVSTFSGLGMNEIWTSLCASVSLIPTAINLRELEERSCNLEETLSSGLRRDVFEVMSLLTLRAPPVDSVEEVLIKFSQYVDEKLPKESKPNMCQTRIQNDAAIVNTELQLLSSLCALKSASFPKTSLASLLSTICHDAGGSLLRFVPYQHILWDWDSGKGLLSSVSQAHLQWLQTIWTTLSPNDAINGPSLLLHSYQLISTIQHCIGTRHSLTTLEDNVAILRREAQLVFMHSHSNIPRIQLLVGLLIQSILSIMCCFPSSFTDGDLQIVSNIIEGHPPGTLAVMRDILVLIATAKEPVFAQAFQLILSPALQLLLNSHNRRDTISNLGRCWVALGKLVLELYVPTAPIDPAAVQNFAGRFWGGEKDRLMAFITSHKQWELEMTGNDSNSILTHLTARLRVAEMRLDSTTSLPMRNRTEITLVHRLWSEVSQFRDQVMSPTKLNNLLSLSMLVEEDMVAQERLLQDSLSGFCQRLDVGYPGHADITFPIQLALSQLRLGLRLVVASCSQSMSSETLSQFASTLIAFPSAQSMSKIISEGAASPPPDLSASRQLLLKLSAVAQERSIGMNIEARIGVVEKAYDQILRLWLISRAKENEKEQTLQSLYRRKPLVYEDAGEADIEEREFLALFPAFEDVLEKNTEEHPETTHQHILGGPSPAEVEQLLSLHISLLHDNIRSVTPSIEPRSIFNNIRQTILTALIDSGDAMFSDHLDVESLPFRLNLLHHRLQSLHNDTQLATPVFNFYSDARISEVRRATVIVVALKKRLEKLVQEWPDQMVLQHLIGRCDTVLSLDFQSPVAKVLSALEQLLMQTEDWEVYANRENTLKTHRQALTDLIVDWRRLELSCWQVLLQSQAETFAAGIADSWFYIYNATIRGCQDAASKDESGIALTNHLHDLVPLLDEYMSASPIGQYEARLNLLRSFETYAAHLAVNKSGGERLAMQRIQHVLHATVAYFQIPSRKISLSLAEQRGALEKDVRGFIKLASWKDVNVHALKASAQRSHRQLYKTIRKFREILRQPVSGQLQAEPAGDAEHQYSAQESYSPVTRPTETPTFPMMSTSQFSHLLNLERTFAKFDELLATTVSSFIRSRSASDINDLSVDIITVSRDLAQLTITKDDSQERRAKQKKGLLVRKRKAWSDLLKELKKAGLSANVKPEILERQGNPRWIREQPIIPSLSIESMSISKGEIYFNRLQDLAALFRASLANHHSDLTTRELQRGHMFLESNLSFALNARARLAEAFESYEMLSRMFLRLQILMTSSKTLYSGVPLSGMRRIQDTVHKVVQTLDEVNDALGIFYAMQTPLDNHVHVLEKMAVHRTTMTSLRARIDTAISNIKLSKFPVLLYDERELFIEAVDQLSHLSASFCTLANNHPPLKYIFDPVREWLDSEEASTNFLEQPGPPIPPGKGTDSIIDSLLITVQDLVRKCIPPGGDVPGRDRDNYMREDVTDVLALTHLLRMDTILEHLDSILYRLVTYSADDLRNNLLRILPFLDRYMTIVKEQLSNHTRWVNTLFKLAYILCSVINNLAKDGFCQPLDGDESDKGGEVDQSAGGVGIGQGYGAENVSKEVEDESQVEGLQGQDESDAPREKENDHDAIEMSEDFGADIEDIPDTGSQEDGESESKSQADPEEQLGKLDSSDPSAVDEKLWGDEAGPLEDDPSEKIEGDRSEEKGGKSDLVAREGRQPSNKKEDKEIAEEQETTSELDIPEEQGEGSEELPNDSGAPSNDHIPDANTLDLPDDIDMGPEQQSTDIDVDENEQNEDDMEIDELNDGAIVDPSNPDQPDHDDSQSDAEDRQKTSQVEDHQSPTGKDDEFTEDRPMDESIGQTDVSAGAGDSVPTEGADPAEGEDEGSGGQQHGSKDQADQDKFQEEDTEKQSPSNERVTQPDVGTSENNGAAMDGTQQGPSPAQPKAQLSSNPLRSLADTLKEIRQRIEEIADSKDENELISLPDESTDAARLEYIRPDEADSEMQALGPARDEEVANLNEISIVEDEHRPKDMTTTTDIRSEEKHMPQDRRLQELPLQLDPTPRAPADSIEGAISQRNEHHGRQPAEHDDASSLRDHDREREPAHDIDVESELRQWQLEGLPTDRAAHIWRLYESLTHDLSYALCEQLRLILEPTLATRLRGDYRTGKRLNMKKIISYIASDYTKDKIWLRRTRPSQREYQVLISLDDSRSMAESHSIHLAFETLALVSKAMTRLEVGDIGIAKFGEAVEILHGFEQGPFSDLAGTKIMSAFRFDQKATNVLSLVETSLKVLEVAKERRSMGSASAADLWQMQIIISDGLCQDHDRLRTVLRKAEEQRVMIVFIIIDSLHSTTSDTSEKKLTVSQNSILSMQQGTYKNIGGRMELQMERYLDSFPFDYYVVLRDVEALPGVLSSTLKQFFEHISEE